MENPGEKALKEQIDFLLAQYANGSVDIHELMKCIDMAYGDYIDFHPEECPSKYDIQELQQGIRSARKGRNRAISAESGENI